MFPHQPAEIPVLVGHAIGTKNSMPRKTRTSSSGKHTSNCGALYIQNSQCQIQRERKRGSGIGASSQPANSLATFSAHTRWCRSKKSLDREQVARSITEVLRSTSSARNRANVDNAKARGVSEVIPFAWKPRRATTGDWLKIAKGYSPMFSELDMQQRAHLVQQMAASQVAGQK